MTPTATIAAGLIALALSGCAGDDENPTTTPAPPVDSPGERATPPSDPGGLPPGFVECMAEQGFEVKSPAEIHSAPPQGLQECFGH